MASALDGVRVIDFGQYVAGPMAAMLLADQGADVIRLEVPGGPRMDSPANATYNRGKRSIVLDLKSPADRETARKLVSTADVVIENFRPGVMDRLGLGAEPMTAANPRLIYCSLPGFAADDPRANVRAWEGVVGAATTTYPRNPQSGKPIYTPLPFSSSYAAFLGAVSIAMALNARERDGIGQVVEVPLFDATYAALGYRGQRVHNAAPGDDVATRMARMMGVTRQFECKDGRWFMYHAGNKNAPDFFAFTEASWLTPGANASPEEIREKTEALFKTKTAAEWEAICEQVATEGSICRTSSEWLHNEHALGSKIVIHSEDAHLGSVTGPGINVRMSETPGHIRGPRPAPDQHRAEVLREVATAQPPAPASVDQTMRAALDGVKVVDLCIVLAGPTCGRTLAEFGADVVRIDSPHRDGVVFHTDINRGKRSLLMDLKTPEGLEIFWKLVDQADVVVQNFRKGVADRLGVGYEAVKARKPDIVYASLNTYGQVGPWANRPGHEQIAQAASGMQERYGGDGRPVLAPFAANDYGTGFMGAYGVALALLHRKKTGQGQHVDTALAYTATMLQSLYLQEYGGKTWDEARGQDALGSGKLNRAYEASDGWFFLAARESDLCGDYAPWLRDAAESDMENAFSGMTVAAAIEKLNAAGAGAHAIIQDARVLMDDPWAQSHGLSITRDHDGQGPVTTIGPSPRLSRTPPVPGRPAPIPGTDAASILADIGMSGDLDRLVKAGVVVPAGRSTL
jgi:crotonobetainyl-CoA:carnitine CoA-transferase CaiB-like acyl-CoA transferase